MRKSAVMTGMIFLFWLSISSLICLPLALSQPLPAQVLGDARLSLLRGDVVLQTEGTGSEWGAAVINTPLIPGTRLWDPENGRSEIQLFGGSYLRASATTEVDITNLSMSASGDVIQVGVPQGRVYTDYAGPGAQNSVFQIDTPVTSVMSYGPSKFEVDVYEDGYTEVSVLNGSVNVQGQNGVTTVDAGTMLSMGSDQIAELSPMRPEDAWISWNLSRDSALVYRGSSRSYLPASLGIYGNDFDSYGDWVQTADYGYVWTPRHVAAGWAPYRIGRWCWVGGDYVWISNEPWGWVPFHYGRWAFVSRIGWCWVPPPRTATVYWSPGFVAWIQTPTYVSWVPLAPGEIYYGHRYYGPNSVNITNRNTNRIEINNVYSNARVTNAVTVVSRETFLTGKRVSVANAPANPFRNGGKVAIGGPAIKPVKATALPDPAKAVSEKVLPPKEVVKKMAQVQRRPAAVQKNVSVFKPGERVKPMQVKKVEHPTPSSVVRQHELRQPSVGQKGEVDKAVGQEKKAAPPAVPQREFGLAPQQGGQPVTPPARREPMTPPPVVTPQAQRPQPAVPNRERLNAPPPVQGGGNPPSAQRREQVAPPVHREFGLAPQQGGQPVTPPARREPMTPPPVVTPQAQRPQPAVPSPQAAVPNRERLNAPPPVQGGGNPPSAQRREQVAPPVHREFGLAPQQGGQPVTPPARREPMSRPTPPPVVTPQAQRPQPAVPSPQAAVPNRERLNAPPPVQGGGNPPSAQRREQVAPPAHNQGTTRIPAQGTAKREELR